MITKFWFIYILAFTYQGEPYSAFGGNNPNAPGVEIRIEHIAGPQGLTKADCVKAANEERKVVAARLGLPSYMLLKYECIELELTK